MTVFRALTNRSFALLWSGQTISRLGDSLYTIALAWLVLQKTGSAAAMGGILICSPRLDLSPLAMAWLVLRLTTSAHPWSLSSVDRSAPASSPLAYCIQPFAP
jgi:hypothetical protein